ncbi:Nucleic acid binding protein [Desulfamplus magnetovallimortis]|uniref:Nucleic acid binding protein n=1 Tax=Desulfamplus magnetovallimortis TaxID=1246637 RepID=A0A1W1HE06_9BACT|nr:DUF3368 domain-containing protein [Desulfamplus magnetovallimortis]SLM30700.1 Nucleic acid binding protein [Desulfamplus magnetovallimortis]
MIVIADSSPLIALAIIEKLAILEKMYKKVYAPTAVFQEVVRTDKPFANELELFLHVRTKNVKNKMAVRILSSDIGAGEAETIVLALENLPAVALIDDLKARRFAKMNEIEVIGTMGILLKGKKEGLIKEVKPLIAKLLQHDIRISTRIIEITLQAAQEL